jgi:Na+/phosphate symporter
MRNNAFTHAQDLESTRLRKSRSDTLLQPWAILGTKSQGMLTIPSSCGLMLGANVGTCVTGMLASIGQPVNGVRLAVSLILFRAAGVAILFPFLSHFIKLVCRLSNVGPPALISNP